MIAILRYIIFIFFLFFSLFVVTPFAILRPFSPKNNYTFFRVFAIFMKVFAGISIKTINKEILWKHRPSIVVGNHQHNLDVLVAHGFFTNFMVVLGKYELGFIPYFGQIYILFGNLLIKRGKRDKALKSMQDLENKIINKKLSVVIFPEGHRNPKRKLLPFKKGAYYTAIKTGVPIIPFSVSQFVSFNQMNKFGMMNVYVKIHEPIPTAGLTKKDIPELITKTRSVIESGIEELNKNYQ